MVPVPGPLMDGDAIDGIHRPLNGAADGQREMSLVAW